LREEEGRRKVTWGTLLDYACGGTHVNTGDVGEILITKVKAKKGELTVQYALHDHPTHGTEIVHKAPGCQYLLTAIFPITAF
jgi:hypothetical protein